MRQAASNPRPGNAGTRTLTVSVMVVSALLVLPAFALYRRGIDLRWAAGYVALTSAVAAWANARDKRLAQCGEWRVSEAQLHFWELIGGWPGAWITQRQLRHKTSKASFQVVLWLIVIAHQFAAVDSLRGWQLSRAGWSWVQVNFATGRR